MNYKKEIGLKVIIGIIVCVPLLTLVLSCGGQVENEPLATKTVSAAEGGSIASSDGKILLEIPPGALTEDTTVAVRIISEDDWTDDVKAVQPTGPVYSLEPDGLEFIQPAKLTVRLDPGDLTELDSEGTPAFISFSRSNEGIWEVLANNITEIQADVGVVTVIAEVDHFSQQLRVAGPLWIKINPESVEKAVGDFWPVITTIGNSGSFVLKEHELLRQFGGKEAVKLYKTRTYISSDLSPGATVTIVPEFTCSVEGTGTYLVGINAEMDIDDAEAFMLALSTLGAEFPKKTFIKNQDRISIFRVKAYGTATCLPAVEESTTPTETETQPPTETTVTEPTETEVPEPTTNILDHTSGIFDGFSAHNLNGQFVSFFTAEGTSNITAAEFFIDSNPAPFKVRIYDKYRILIKEVSANPQGTGWQRVELPEPTAVEGNFYVSIVYTADGVPLIGRDSSNPQDRSWVIDPNGTWTPWSEKAGEFDLPDGEFGIRVEVIPQ